MSLEVLVYVSGKSPFPGSNGISTQLPSLQLSGSWRPDSKLTVPTKDHLSGYDFSRPFALPIHSCLLEMLWSAVYTVLGHVPGSAVGTEDRNKQKEGIWLPD